jgi:Tfp pilus assembly protein PilN
MIKINLLPRKKRERKRTNLESYVLLGTVAFSLALVSSAYLINAKDIRSLHNEISSVKQQSRALEGVRMEFSSLERDKKEVASKLAVIQRINEGRAIAPKMLYDLSSIVKDNLWLRRLRKDDAKLEIEGRSADNESICDFVERLSRLPYMKNIELRSVEDVNEAGILVKKFIVEGSVAT